MENNLHVLEFEPIPQKNGACLKKGNAYTGTELIIPSHIEINGKDYPLIEIGEYAFSGCVNLTKVVIPVAVEKVGWSAFAYCSNLSSIVVSPENEHLVSKEKCNAVITKKDKTLVAGCKSTYIPSYVKEIQGESFMGCTGLTSIDIPASVGKIGWGAFRGCTGLNKIEIPKTVIKIGCEVFHGCTNLSSIIIAEENPEYDSRENCNAVIETYTNTLISGCKNTTIPNSVKIFKTKAFGDCIGLTSINIPNSVINIWPRSFENCTSLTKVVMGESVAEIGFKAFENCTSLVSINIPNSVTYLDGYAFANCTSLTSIEIPNSITEIKRGLFQGCSRLKRIVIPGTVTSIKELAFDGCDALEDICVPLGKADYYKGVLPKELHPLIKESFIKRDSGF